MQPGLGSLSPRPIGSSTSLYVWGNDRSRLNRAVRAIAGAIDPEFEWVEAVDGAEPSRGPRANADRPRFGSPLPAVPSSCVTEGEHESGGAVGPGPRVGAGGRHRDPARARAQSGLLPPPLGRLLAHPPPRALVVANADRLGGSETGTPAGVGRLVEPLNWLGITLFATHQGPPAADRASFDYSLADVSNLPHPPPKGWALVCQWGNCERCLVRERFGPGRVGCFGTVLATLRQRRSKETERLGSRDDVVAPLGRPLAP